MLQKGSSGAKRATPRRDMPRGQKKDSKPLRTNAHGLPHDLLSLTARPSFVASFQGQRVMGANTENSFGESRSEPPYTNIDAFCSKPLQGPKSRFENPTPSNSMECVRHRSRTVLAMTGVSPIGHKTKKPGRANTPRNWAIALYQTSEPQRSPMEALSMGTNPIPSSAVLICDAPDTRKGLQAEH